MDLTTRAGAVRALPAFEVVLRQHFPAPTRGRWVS
ncbi:MAG: hypothetical protein KatS3mg014_0874 [Actinomycetota bacterium]|nr:MAG: hypothetical protein KatS3mg014_0874 [Actinomycetota bacterium]